MTGFRSRITGMLRDGSRIGWGYLARVRVTEPWAARVRGAVTRSVSRGPGLRLGPGVRFEKDRRSAIEFGADCQVQAGVLMHSAGEGRRGAGSTISIGSGSIIKAGAEVLAHSGRITLGRRSALGRDSYIICRESTVAIGNCVRIARNVSMITGQHNFSRLDIPIMEQGRIQKPIQIEDDVWIGMSAIVLAGVTIETGSVVAAGAVVTRDVPARAVVAGVPARIVRMR